MERETSTVDPKGTVTPAGAAAPVGAVGERPGERVTIGAVFATWWPLAASWLLMGFEGPAIAAVIARLADPEIHLAAYGGVVFPLALIVEAPIIMLLAASTTLSRDAESYRRLRRFTHWAGALLTVAHVAIAVTPLFDLVVGRLIGPPPEVLGPARLGLIVMIPWTWAIAYRRFNQGVLIRFGRSRSVGAGTAVRLAADAAVLVIGYAVGSIPGVIVGASAVIAGVLLEAAYVRWRVEPILQDELPPASETGEPPSFRGFLAFYVPLSMTSVLALLVQPIGAAALSRMPMALESLALWPVVIGLVFIFRSFGFAYNEVVVALLDRPGAARALNRFTYGMAAAVTLGFSVLLVPPVGWFWFEDITGLAAPLVQIGRESLWLALPMPALSVAVSWFQGLILFGRRTGAVSEAVALSLTATVVTLVAAVLWGAVAGIYAGVASVTLGETVRIVWLWWRSRRIRRCLRGLDGDHGTAEEVRR